MTDQPNENLGWWTISGKNIMAMLYRVKNGEDPDFVYMEEYANAEIISKKDDE